jgi:hypothetical protein
MMEAWLLFDEAALRRRKSQRANTPASTIFVIDGTDERS